MFRPKSVSNDRPRSSATGCLFALLFLAAPAWGQAPDLTKKRSIVPDAIPGVETLQAEDVIERAMRDDELIIIDARISKDRDHGFIEGSVSLPDIHTNCERLQQIAGDKHKPLLFYCNGVRCGRSVVSIKIAQSCGYRNLLWFRGGFEEWKTKGYQYVTEN